MHVSKTSTCNGGWIYSDLLYPYRKVYLDLPNFGRAVAALGFYLSEEEVALKFRQLDYDGKGIATSLKSFISLIIFV